ncbi:NHLP leader peptide family RiPP precursor [Pelotomaculum propionicicum]|uniref:Nitrile hydratase alpha/Thiocyanate hydrolase gamma domain-containing protein n=1 Tax=Pelotomaculum propionicicum TaxID=258475 RepID=A0A4Y7RME6_9FIRM|nr:NHLP leader peptide family RiPP precursor [Pelotomaculum propionicicum]TEB09920.1 hypothetical protein Pmgp_02723 [Pelotomaculum propionicicum]
MDREEMNKKMGQVIARAWSDADFKARLLADPAETLRAEGIEFPAGVKVKAVENTSEQFYLVIPQKPDELSDEKLDTVAGGYCGSRPCSVQCNFCTVS